MLNFMKFWVGFVWVLDVVVGVYIVNCVVGFFYCDNGIFKCWCFRIVSNGINFCEVFGYGCFYCGFKIV